MWLKQCLLPSENSNPQCCFLCFPFLSLSLPPTFSVTPLGHSVTTECKKKHFSWLFFVLGVCCVVVGAPQIPLIISKSTIYTQSHKLLPKHCDFHSSPLLVIVKWNVRMNPSIYRINIINSSPRKSFRSIRKKNHFGYIMRYINTYR